MMTSSAVTATGPAPSAVICAFGFQEPDVSFLEASVWRAVEIYPGHGDEPIVVRQHLAFSAEHMDYDVVSCNVPEGGGVGQVKTPDGSVIEINAALVQMMQYLRLPSKSRIIWNSAMW